MKRPVSSDAAETPPRRRKRGLSEEDRALWELIARQVKPLKKKPRPARPHPPMSPAPEPMATPIPASSRPIAAVPMQKPVKPALPPLVQLGRRERSRLSRGHSDIEARLDLHGMTQSRAHQALHGFLQRAHRDGLTFVLVITGKGTIGDSERGVLRRQVPHWLSLPEFRALIVGFEEAHVGHGGAGALYVRVRRARG
jgi:DNA-nicking Smr family endonuclease